MPTRLTLAFALLLALAPRPAHTQEPRVPFLAVLEFRVENKVVPLDTAATLANLVRSRVVHAAGGTLKLISREQVFEILSKANKSATQCTAECEVQTAREIGADYVLTGSISPLGDKAVLVLDVKKAKDGVTMASASAKALAKALDEKLDGVIRELMADLLPKLSAAPAVAKAPAEKPPQPSVGGGKEVTGGAVVAKVPTEKTPQPSVASGKAASGGGPGVRTKQQVDVAKAIAKGEFRDNGDGTVTQMDGGLVWQKADSGQALNLADAAGYCAALSVAGRGWRLPSIEELVRLIDKKEPHGQMIDLEFVNIQKWFWSSSRADGGAGLAWAVGGNPYHSGTLAFLVSELIGTRCVR